MCVCVYVYFEIRKLASISLKRSVKYVYFITEGLYYNCVINTYCKDMNLLTPVQVLKERKLTKVLLCIIIQVCIAFILLGL